MSGLTIPLIALTTAMGYFFSKDGKNERSVEVKRTDVSDYEKTNDNNIYDSNMYTNVNRHMLKLSANNYRQAKNPAETGMIPPLFNTYSSVGQQLDTINGSSIKEQSEINDINRVVDVTQIGKNKIPIDKRPMFFNFVGIEEPRKYEGEVSLLTGLPSDTSHNNMVPFFGSNVKQNIEGYTNEMVLDRYNGNQSSYMPKKEIGNFFSEKKQYIYGTQLVTDDINKERYIPSVYRQNDVPFEYEMVNAPISGTIDNNIRPNFKTVDELRVASNLKETYEGRVISGRQGEVRGVQSAFEKNKPDTFYEQNQDRYIKTTGRVIAHKVDEDYSTNFKTTSRNDYNISYYGHANSDLKETMQRMKLDNNEESGDSLVQESKKFNFKNDYLRNYKGEKNVNDYGKCSLVNYETERATANDNPLTNATKMTKGGRTRFSDLAKNTNKETTLLFDNTGNVKTSFNKGIKDTFDIGMSEFDPRVTQKESTMINNYTGIVDKADGKGYIVTKYDAKTTGKEIITENSSYIHNPKFASQQISRQNYDNAEIFDRKENTLQIKYNAGPNIFNISSGKDIYGDVEYSSNKLLTEDLNNRTNNFESPNMKVISDKNVIGKTSSAKEDDNLLLERINPLIMDQLANNPYVLH